MPITTALLLPGSPLPLLHPSNPPWGALADGMVRAGDIIAESEPDLIVIYSTQWIAVLDQLWQTRRHLSGSHVDENWHEYGDIPFSIRIDTEFAQACVTGATSEGIRSKAVDYDSFPIDTGTLVAAHFLDPKGTQRFAITSNNLYHDDAMTQRIGEVVRKTAEAQDKRIAVVGIGGLSGSVFREEISVETDRIANPEEDQWNSRILNLLANAQVDELRLVWSEYVAAARVDMGFKHMAFLLGALNSRFHRAEILAYGPAYGTGAAVVHFKI